VEQPRTDKSLQENQTLAEPQSSASTSLERRGRPKLIIFVLPNLFTTANLFCGYFSIMASIQGQWDKAAYAIGIAAIFDAFDGRVARITKTQSSFGEQYDSMSDLLSFGVAPAVLMFQWALTSYGKLGFMASFLYVTCAALRLARFNVMKQSTEKRYFQGCPSPIAACSVASSVLFYSAMGLSAERSIYMLIVMILLACLMISTVRYRSFKDSNLRSQAKLGYMMFILGVLILIASDPDRFLAPVFAVYLGSGILMEMMRFLKKKPPKSSSPPRSVAH
jgi:CDP-diacylglycerol--serine O-phosphatidyltransferase